MNQEYSLTFTPSQGLLRTQTKYDFLPLVYKLLEI